MKEAATVRSVYFDPPPPPKSEIYDIRCGRNSIMSSTRSFLADILPNLTNLGILGPDGAAGIYLTTPSAYTGKLCMEVEKEVPFQRGPLPLGNPSQVAGHVTQIHVSKARREFLKANAENLALGVSRLPQDGEIWKLPTSFYGFKLEGDLMLPDHPVKVDVADALWLYRASAGPVMEQGPTGFVAVLGDLLEGDE